MKHEEIVKEFTTISLLSASPLLHEYLLIYKCIVRHRKQATQRFRKNTYLDVISLAGRIFQFIVEIQFIWRRKTMRQAATLAGSRSWVAAVGGAARQLSTEAAAAMPAVAPFPPIVFENLGLTLVKKSVTATADMYTRGKPLLPPGSKLAFGIHATKVSQAEMDAVVAMYAKHNIKVVYSKELVGTSYKGLAGKPEEMARSFVNLVETEKPYAVGWATGEGGEHHVAWELQNMRWTLPPYVKVRFDGFSYDARNAVKDPIPDRETYHFTQAVYRPWLEKLSHVQVQELALQHGSHIHLRGIKPAVNGMVLPRTVEGIFQVVNLSVFSANSQTPEWDRVDGQIIGFEEFDAPWHAMARLIRRGLDIANERGASGVVIFDIRPSYHDARDNTAPVYDPNKMSVDEIKQAKKAAAIEKDRQTDEAIERVVETFYSQTGSTMPITRCKKAVGHGTDNLPVAYRRKICMANNPLTNEYETIIDGQRDLGAAELIAAGAQITAPEPQQALSFTQIMAERQRQLGLNGEGRCSSL